MRVGKLEGGRGACPCLFRVWVSVFMGKELGGRGSDRGLSKLEVRKGVQRLLVELVGLVITACISVIPA